MIILLLFSGCAYQKKAEEFLDEHKEDFENNWWDYFYQNEQYCFNPYEDNSLWLYDIKEEDVWLWDTWSFTPPNTYHFEGYDISVVGKDECYELKIGLLIDTVCECPVKPDWREPW